MDTFVSGIRFQACGKTSDVECRTRSFIVHTIKRICKEFIRQLTICTNICSSNGG
jgi:hypothetical protein